MAPDLASARGDLQPPGVSINVAAQRVCKVSLTTANFGLQRCKDRADHLMVITDPTPCATSQHAQ
jgi:hypothetical protein